MLRRIAPFTLLALIPTFPRGAAALSTAATTSVGHVPQGMTLQHYHLGPRR